MTEKIDEIRQQLTGRTGMSREIEEDLFTRIAEIEDASGIVPSMTKADLYVGIIVAAVFGILPVILVGAGVL